VSARPCDAREELQDTNRADTARLGVSSLAADQLIREIVSNQNEDQVVYRGGERRVARLRRLRHGTAGGLEVPKGQPYRLEITSRGQLDNVALRPAARQQPGPGQVEIRVQATGLNFRDVLNVLNLYPGDPGPLGGECAGEVVAVGPGVEHFRAGDQVLGLAPASFASYVTTLAEFVAVKPEHLSHDEAATIPICFLTAHLALRRLGNMKRGERVLIHAASGGVGLAAIQIAKQIGAEIFATAGSPKKRDYLKSLGIEHVMDSRSTDFARQIQEATGGEGIDLVVNSLTGETIGASLSVLRAGGRFLELGKTDLWDQKRVDEFRPGVTFYAIALDRMMAEEPQTVDQLMREVMAEFSEKKLDPLPLRSFPIPRVVDALRHMARAEHIGKVVIQAVETGEAGDGGLTLREDASYLVTGGLGGLGLKLARWLVDRGCKNLVLTGRSAPSEDAQRQLDGLQKSGAKIAVRKCDVGRRDDVAALLAGIGQELPPLRGVFHLAGVLDDGVLREQNRERFDRVMASKVLGAWNLHELTQDQPMDLFVLFSSAAALLGSPGQGNYAAANAFLDVLAAWRRWHKQPGLSVNWGSWAEVGMASRLKDSEGRRWSATGIGWIEPAQGLRTLEQLLAEDRVQAGVLPIDWPKFFERIPAGSEPAWLAEMARGARAAGSADTGPPVLLERLKGATPSERIGLALAQVRQAAAEVLAMGDAELPDPRRPLNELGFDSLTGVEFCNRVGRSVGEHLNPTLLFDYPTLESLAAHVVRDILRLETDGEPPAAQPQPAPEAVQDEIRDQTLAEVEAMSEDEMDALVDAQLEKLGQ
jgi:NADPH:quinone reductase-like Zn-dependent oxidoreductase